MIRNQAGTIKVFAFNRTNNNPVTGDAANITCQYDLDGIGLLALADTNPTEKELGYYVFNVNAAECNGTTVDFYPESTTSNVQVIVVEHDRYIQAAANGSIALPFSGAVADRVEGTKLQAFYKENTPIAIAVTDSSGNAVTVTGLTLRVAIEDKKGTDVLTISDGSITKSGSTVTFTVTTAVTNQPGTYNWALRDITSGNKVLLQGVLDVVYAAELDV